MKIADFLEKHEKLYFCALIIRFGGNKKFRKKVNSITKDPRQVVIEKRGSLYRGRLIYELDPVVHNAGFFAVFRRMLSGLYYADEIGATPYISYSNDFLYAEKSIINGTNEPFEYYFQPLNNVTKEGVNHANAVIRFESKHIRLAEVLNGSRQLIYTAKDEYLDAMAVVLKKYIHLNKEMDEYVNRGISELGLTDSTVAVHCRGTDYNIGSKEHPIIVTPEDYFTILDEWIVNGCFNHIFLATDDQNCLDKFITHYGNCLSYYKDVERAKGNEGVHFSQSNRVNHKYRLGAEVIRDVYTMAYCKGLLAGMSEVSICTRIIKRAQNSSFEKELILNKGIVLRGRSFSHK